MSDRLEQIKNTALRVTPVDVGKWELSTGVTSVADGVLISVVDFNWMIVNMRKAMACDHSAGFVPDDERQANVCELGCGYERKWL